MLILIKLFLIYCLLYENSKTGSERAKRSKQRVKLLRMKLLDGRLGDSVDQNETDMIENNKIIICILRQYKINIV